MVEKVSIKAENSEKKAGESRGARPVDYKDSEGPSAGGAGENEKLKGGERERRRDLEEQEKLRSSKVENEREGGAFSLQNGRDDRRCPPPRSSAKRHSSQKRHRADKQHQGIRRAISERKTESQFTETNSSKLHLEHDTIWIGNMGYWKDRNGEA